MKSIKTKNGFEIRCLTNDYMKAYVVITENRCYLVDTGPSTVKKKMLTAVNELKSQGYSFEALILTHSHSDHVANAHILKSTFQIPVFAHKWDGFDIENGLSAPIKGTTFLTKGISKITKILPSTMAYAPCEVTIKIDDQMEIGKGIRVIHTAGHTAGSLTVCIDDEIALVGDALFGIHKNTIFPDFLQDEEAVYKSWKALSALDYCAYIPSHGSIISKAKIDAEILKRENNF